MGFRHFTINEISIISGDSGNSHNGIFRGKDLGTISNLNEYLAFRSAHGIDDNTYKDLYLGDYFKIQDGTYNVVWMVAHFDYYNNKGTGGTGVNNKGVVLIPRTYCGSSKMNNTNTSEGAYKDSLAHNIACPAIASALSSVFGSYLKNISASITRYINPNTASMMGAGYTGASTGWVWTATQCILPNEIQIYGSTVTSSSWLDIGEACEKLAVFNFINNVEYTRSYFWLRNVADSSCFGFSYYDGSANINTASNDHALRPLIYIG